MNNQENHNYSWGRTVNGPQSLTEMLGLKDSQIAVRKILQVRMTTYEWKGPESPQRDRRDREEPCGHLRVESTSA